MEKPNIWDSLFLKTDAAASSCKDKAGEQAMEQSMGLAPTAGNMVQKDLVLKQVNDLRINCFLNQQKHRFRMQACQMVVLAWMCSYQHIKKRNSEIASIWIWRKYLSETNHCMPADINECLGSDLCDQHPNSECADTEGSYTCACKTGYKRNPGAGGCIGKHFVYSALAALQLSPSQGSLSLSSIGNFNQCRSPLLLNLSKPKDYLVHWSSISHLPYWDQFPIFTTFFPTTTLHLVWFPWGSPDNFLNWGCRVGWKPILQKKKDYSKHIWTAAERSWCAWIIFSAC